MFRGKLIDLNACIKKEIYQINNLIIYHKELEKGRNYTQTEKNKEKNNG